MTIFEYALTQERIGTVFSGVQPETIWLPLMQGNVPSFANHLLMWLTVHHF